MSYKITRSDELLHGDKKTSTKDGYTLPGRSGRTYKYIHKFVKNGKTRYVYQSTSDKSGRKRILDKDVSRTDHINRYNDNVKYTKQEEYLKGQKDKVKTAGAKTKISLQIINVRVMKALNNIGTAYLDNKLKANVSSTKNRLRKLFDIH